MTGSNESAMKRILDHRTTISAITTMGMIMTIVWSCSRTDGLIGHWVHAHEEDSAGVQVYRPIRWSLPLSRGRESWDVARAGKLVHHGIGADDVPIEEP